VCSAELRETPTEHPTVVQTLRAVASSMLTCTLQIETKNIERFSQCKVTRNPGTFMKMPRDDERDRAQHAQSSKPYHMRMHDPLRQSLSADYIR